ncbi:hypothetical protein EX30DRAFT_303572 [Ascodesmis nigricans]|uniref:Cytochrome c oxidase assembly protein n=1 Tax=Ascodesmis nigricans TaxID=341454 RepID=A0A4S2N593_9PEZI|nr:hypothetical protein EX30DRAFT_303572 [Ascodesmis nigricans]
MSRAAKGTLLGTTLLCGATVAFVHYVQTSEKAAMHQGVIRDEERRRIQLERKLDFEMQKQLQDEMLKEQSVRDTSDEAPPLKGQ